MFGLGRLGKLGSVGRALAWTPAQLWPLGATSPGMWIDPPYVASLYQDSAGTTAISAIGTVLDTSNPVGLALDRKGNLALGPELVTNGDCSTLTGWTASAQVTSAGGKFVFTAAGVDCLYQAIRSAGAKPISEITFDLVVTSGQINCGLGGDGSLAQTFTTSGSKSLRLTASGAANGNFVFSCVSGTFTGTIDNISVKEIPGIHLSQATGTSRPVASARKNLLVGTAALATQSVTVIAAQCVLSFTGTGTVTLSGTSTAGPLIGTGAADRVSITFTPTAGSLTLTVSGSVTLAQLEYRA